MVRKIIILSLVLSLFLISGCNDYVVLLDSNSSSQCLIDCKGHMENKRCFSSVPIFSSEYLNGVYKDYNCECALLDCFK